MSGINYYHRKNICECCERYDEVHIGKASVGWQFSFHGTDEIRDNLDWVDQLQTGQIFDEYGNELSSDEFLKLVGESRGKHNYAVKYPSSRDWIDLNGWSFADYEFS